MEGLYYSTSSKTLFWIPKYYTNGSGNVDTLIENLQEGRDVIKKYVQEGTTIYANEIYNSNWCKYKWYFCATCEECPEDAMPTKKSIDEFIMG